jgi:antitoxin MazE
MMNLAITKWGNSLAVRIPAELIKEIGVKEGDQLQAHWGTDGTLNLRPANWSRKAFGQELAQHSQQLPLGNSVMDVLRQEARY